MERDRSFCLWIGDWGFGIANQRILKLYMMAKLWRSCLVSCVFLLPTPSRNELLESRPACGERWGRCHGAWTVEKSKYTVQDKTKGQGTTCREKT